MEECAVAFYAGSVSIELFGAELFNEISVKLGEYLTGSEGLINSEIGGVDDSAAWTAFMQVSCGLWYQTKLFSFANKPLHFL